MLSRLLPKEHKFYDLFDQAAGNVLEACKQLADLTEHYDDLPGRVAKMKELEHAADRLTHETLARLNKTFVTPFDREDIYALAVKMDDIIDFVDAAINRFYLYKIPAPTPQARRLALAALQQAEVLVKAVHDIRNLDRFNELLQDCIEINRLENEADNLLREAMAELFDREKDPIAVIKWKEIYEDLETATDRCEDVADVLQNIVMKNS